MTARFKVGDRVRITQPGLRAGPVGYEFTITDLVHSWNPVSDNDAYYMGDEGGHGVWDAYVELVEPAVDWEAEYNELLVKYETLEFQHKRLQRDVSALRSAFGRLNITGGQR